MKINDLINIVPRLNPATPLHKQLENTLGIGPGYGRAWYNSQQEHWVRWLAGYATPGPYGRKPNESASARLVYNRLMCPPMIYWLAEAGGVASGLLDEAYRAAVSADPHCARQSKAVRDCLPWRLVEAALIDKPVPLDLGLAGLPFRPQKLCL